MRYVNTLCDTRIRYRPRECDMRYANIGYARAIYAKGRANTLYVTRIGYALCPPQK